MVDSFKNAYFVHELRGLKGRTAHAPEEDVEDADDTDSEDLDHSGNPQQAFDVFFNNVDRARIDPDNWFIDVGLEVYDPGMVVHWNKLAHPAILKYILPSLDKDQIYNLQRSKPFHLHNVAQLEDFAGFSCEPGQCGTDNGVHYINVYTTAKCPTYQLHQGIWRRQTCQDLLPNKLDVLVENLVNMSKTFKCCSGSESNPPQEGCAHLEICVPLRLAESVLLNPPQDLLCQWTISVPSFLWW